MGDIVIGPTLLKGLFEAERILGWRPWIMTGLSSYFAHCHSISLGDGKDFNALLTPIDQNEYKQWQNEFIQNGDGDELAEVVLIAAYSFDKEPLNFIKQRFENGSSLNRSCLTAFLTYFILNKVEIDPKEMSERGFESTRIFHHEYDNRNLCYSFWEMFPESISDNELLKIIPKEQDQRLLRDHVALIGRLIKNGHDLIELIVEVSGWPEIRHLFAQGIAKIVIDTHDLSLADAFLRRSGNAKYPFVIALLKGGGYGFLDDTINTYPGFPK